MRRAAPDYNDALLPYDLTRGGSPFVFDDGAGRHAGAAPSSSRRCGCGDLTVNAGVRHDEYRFLVERPAAAAASRYRLSRPGPRPRPAGVVQPQLPDPAEREPAALELRGRQPARAGERARGAGRRLSADSSGASGRLRGGRAGVAGRPADARRVGSTASCRGTSRTTTTSSTPASSSRRRWRAFA